MPALGASTPNSAQWNVLPGLGIGLNEKQLLSLTTFCSHFKLHAHVRAMLFTAYELMPAINWRISISFMGTVLLKLSRTHSPNTSED